MTYLENASSGAIVLAIKDFIKAYDDGLNTEEVAPNGEDYNELTSAILGLIYGSLKNREDVFRLIAQRHGYRWVEDAMPFAEGPGIVHAETFTGMELKDDSVYATWEACCAEAGLHPDARNAKED